jgi:hypothetical protein
MFLKLLLNQAPLDSSLFESLLLNVILPCNPFCRVWIVSGLLRSTNMAQLDPSDRIATAPSTVDVNSWCWKDLCCF